DATREEILRALGAERARMLVVAISDPAATRRMVRVARSLNPRIHIIARTRYVTEVPELSRLAADVVIPEELGTSIEIFARVPAWPDRYRKRKQGGHYLASACALLRVLVCRSSAYGSTSPKERM